MQHHVPLYRTTQTWVKRRTTSFDAGHFESYLTPDSPIRRRPYTAVKRISKTTAKGKGKILPATQMDQLCCTASAEFLDSIGHSLNLGVNELADVLHTFYLNVVAGGSSGRHGS